MARVLGIDLGTSSVGWAIIEENTSVIKLGSHIFPVGVQEDAYNKSHVEKPKNEARRTARGIRRLNQRYKQRRQKLISILHEIEAMPEEAEIKLPSRYLYFLRKKGLDEKLTLKEFGRILLLLNQRRGFKSNRKTKENESNENGIVKPLINDLQNEIDKAGARTVGEYFSKLFPAINDKEERFRNNDEPVQRIRKRFVGREMYQHEFDMLWTSQKRYHSILTPELKERIGNETIFYQRKLKSVKDLVSNCYLEPKSKCIAKSHPLFQEFRTWQYLTSVRVTDKYRVSEPLSIEEMRSLSNLFKKTSKKIRKTDLIKTISLGSKVEFNEVANQLTGEKTIVEISDALNEVPNYEELEWIWHTLHSADDDQKVWQTFVNKGYNEEQSSLLIEISLEKDYARLSKKAITKILPYLKQGYVYSEACRLAEYDHSGNNDLGVEKDLKETSDYVDLITNPLVKRSINESIRLIKAIKKEYNPDEIRIEFARELNMPKVKRENITKENRKKEKIREEYRSFLKSNFPNIANIGRDELIKFELFLELEFNENDLKKIAEEINLEDYKKLEANANKDDILKYRLWKECNRISVYTGKTISLSQLFSPEIHIEHIIPFSRSYDNSFSNKSLCEAKINDEKKNKTPFEFYKGNPNEWQGFKLRVNKLKHNRKKSLFLLEEINAEWGNNQLSNTAYAAKVLKAVCDDVLFKDKKVHISSGVVTSILRGLWGLNSILSGNDQIKTRQDHRHHAIDALVVACTSKAAVQKLSTLAGISYRGKLELTGSLDYPFSQFREQVKDATEEIFVTYRKEDRLISKRKNPYKYWQKGNEKPNQVTISPRGRLHEETLYGQISNPEKQDEQVYVTRKELNTFDKIKQIENVVDKSVRERLRKHLEKHNNDFKAAFNEPLEFKDKKGKLHYIRHVRVKVPGKLNSLRGGHENELFVASGSNYGMAIYEDETGKRDFQTISFFQAFNSKLGGKKLFPPEINHKPFKVFLQINDLIVMYKNNEEEINWNDKKELFARLARVIKININGGIVIGRSFLTGYNADKATSISNPEDITSGIVSRFSASSFKGVKVKVDILGNLYRI